MWKNMRKFMFCWRDICRTFIRTRNQALQSERVLSSQRAVSLHRFQISEKISRQRRCNMALPPSTRALLQCVLALLLSFKEVHCGTSATLPVELCLHYRPNFDVVRFIRQNASPNSPVEVHVQSTDTHFIISAPLWHLNRTSASACCDRS